MKHEYIVVGSGAGGGPVAANLAAAGHSVLLLEAGGRPESYNYQVPAFHPGASEEEDMAWNFFPRHYADEEQAKRDWKYVEKEKGVLYPRAGTLGGCTAHNAMIFVYPANSDWDRIAEETGDKSWRAARMRRYFQRLERCSYRPVQRWFHRVLGWNPSRHGFAGWLSSCEADPKLVLGDDELLKLIKRSVLRLLFSFGNAFRRLLAAILAWGDPNDWWLVKLKSEGSRFTPLNVDGGGRCGSRERLLAVAEKHPDRLEIHTGALVTRVLFADDDPTRAIGVAYLEGEHLYQADPAHRPGQPATEHQVFASREVILAGGAFNTPQLLQLSGIGPPELLNRHGIEVRVPLPGVGENLQDRYEAGVVSRMKRPFAMLADATMVPPLPDQEPDPCFVQWRDFRTGIYTTNGAVLSVIKRSQEDRRDPDLYLFGLVTDFRGYYPGYAQRVQRAKDYFTWAILKGYTHNTAGRVAITSADPTARPEIDFHYFEEGNDSSGEDLEAVVEAVEFVRRLQRSYRHLIAEEEAPGKKVQSREEIRQWVRDTAWGHHASCTCKIGADDDPKAVLDSRFRVRGTSGLRVVDASVFPRIPGLFIVAAVYMVGEKASDVILEDAKRTPMRGEP